MYIVRHCKKKLFFFFRCSILRNLGDGQLCSLVGICSESNLAKPANYLTHAGAPSLECQFCEKVHGEKLASFLLRCL